MHQRHPAKTAVCLRDVILALAVDGSGGIEFSFPWPVGLPPGLSLYYQYWITDAGGPAGFEASNGLVSTTL